MRSLHTKAHTFASPTSPSTDQSLQKSVLFGNPKRNSIFFSHPLVFYFFATLNRHKSSLTMTAKTLTDRDFTMTMDRRPACNSGFMKLAVQWLNEHLCFVIKAMLADSFVLRNRQLLKPANRYVLCCGTPYHDKTVCNF
jgi:hypothetical protein